MKYAIITALSLITPLTRQWYGDNKDKVPNKHCYWDDGIYSSSYGWVENDQHFKGRLRECYKIQIEENHYQINDSGFCLCEN